MCREQSDFLSFLVRKCAVENFELAHSHRYKTRNETHVNIHCIIKVTGLHRQGIEGIDIAFGGESVKPCDAFKYLGVILDSSLSLNQHIDYVKKKVSKMLGIFFKSATLINN